MFDSIYPFLVFIIKFISSLHIQYNTTTMQSSMNSYLHVKFNPSPSRKFLHYLIHSSQLSRRNLRHEKGKNISQWHKVIQWQRWTSTMTPGSSLLAPSPTSPLFPEDSLPWMSGTFWVLFPARIWSSGQRLKLKMNRRGSWSLLRCGIYHKSKPNSDEFCLNC